MAMMQDFKKTITGRVKADPSFADALRDEAATLFLDKESMDVATSIERLLKNL